MLLGLKCTALSQSRLKEKKMRLKVLYIKESGTVDHRTMTADIKEEVGSTLVDISKKTRKQRATKEQVNTLVKSYAALIYTL